jgi:hypothetical protein
MSHASSEWELLKIAEDIEQGDKVLVESDDGEPSESMIFMKDSGKIIVLRDKSGEIHKFSSSTLESVENNRYISRKAEDGE